MRIDRRPVTMEEGLSKVTNKHGVGDMSMTVFVHQLNQPFNRQYSHIIKMNIRVFLPEDYLAKFTYR